MSSNRPMISELAHALHADDRWRTMLDGRAPVIFLDYDGVLTPIVDDPAAATLDDQVRAVVEDAAAQLTVAVISGRDLDDVRSLVDIAGIAYAGSHGFDMLLPDGSRERKGEEYLDDLDEVERQARDRLDGPDGVTVERKRYAIAVHTRRVRDEPTRRRTARVVRELAEAHRRLRVTGGKDIEEFRPDIDWDKGRALRHLMDVLGLDTDRHPPVYVGDDLTDEDAFAVVADVGVGVVVEGEDDRRTAATLRLDDPAETGDLLRLLVDHATKDTS
ncbi:MAG: trehalose-phosphatase [Actinobacteria bacterium]|nr:trehalose-phosphatase [Actinomycetota bacterium]